MGQSEQAKTCTLVCRVISAVLGIILFFLLRPGYSVVLSLILAVLAAVILAVLLKKLFCSSKEETPLEPASMATPVAATEPEAAEEPAAEEQTTEEAPAAARESDGPEVLTAARDGNADDLKKIKGVGPGLEKTLNELGFFHFDQIAAWTEADVEWVDSRLKFKGRITRDDWIGQAKDLAGN